MNNLLSKLLLILISISISGCAKFDIKLFTDTRDPLKERTLEGYGSDKILVIPVKGFISDSTESNLLYNESSVLQDFISQLKLAEKDDDIKAIVIKIDSPGGTVTASDIIYKEIVDFKARTGKKVVVSMFNVAASGGYYIALSADYIFAHPTTLTGSVGVIFMRPQLSGLMDKIGVGVDVTKSGTHKDMGSPFRTATKEEIKLFQDIIDNLSGRFINLVKKNRKISDDDLKTISTAKVVIADEALKLNMIDKIGYLDDAIKKAAEISGTTRDYRVVSYRRSVYPDDNIYNNNMSLPGRTTKPIIDLGIFSKITKINSGFYYLWLPGIR